MKKLLHILMIAWSLAALLAACGTPQVQPAANVSVNVSADGKNHPVTLPAGSTVQQALDAAKVSLSQTDRVSPPAYTVLTDGSTIVVTRVKEEFETKQVVIPFQRNELRNESLTAGETRLVQAGQNGLSEITIRHVFENGVETSSSTVSETILQPAVPEIVMIGVQSPFAPVSIPGTLAYLTGGNAWVMDTSTSNRRPLVTSADLDGHIFSLSPDGKWLLFSRKAAASPDQTINSLWVVSTTDQPATPIDLGITNVVHFADWQPGQHYLIAYSTVEPRPTAPGWDANNDLHFITFQDRRPGKVTDILDTNYGGIYPWWGMSFAWSPDGQSLAFSRPDGVGLVDFAGKQLSTLLPVTSFNTHGDWAWTPGLAWSRDGQSLYLVTHAPSSGLVAPEESPNFDLSSLNLSDHTTAPLVPQTGMFAYPAVAPAGNTPSAGSIAYLQAVFTAQSATSRYRLMVVGSDGKDPRLLFPAEGQPGLDPQQPVWAPAAGSTGTSFIAIIYEGNLWLIDTVSGQTQQVNGDGLTSKLDWK